MIKSKWMWQEIKSAFVDWEKCDWQKDLCVEVDLITKSLDMIYHASIWSDIFLSL